MSNACNLNSNVKPSLFLSPGPYVELWVPQPKAPNWKWEACLAEKKEEGGGGRKNKNAAVEIFLL